MTPNADSGRVISSEDRMVREEFRTSIVLAISRIEAGYPGAALTGLRWALSHIGRLEP
jgi:hypothetical protein